jgi:hypothetical protein
VIHYNSSFNRSSAYIQIICIRTARQFYVTSRRINWSSVGLAWWRRKYVRQVWILCHAHWSPSAIDNSSIWEIIFLFGLPVPLTLPFTETEPSVWGWNRAALFLGDINTGTWPYRLGESRIWNIKIRSWVLRDSDPRMTALTRTINNCKRQTHPLLREDVT